MQLPAVYAQALAGSAGSRDDGYRKVRKLGEGTYAVVFEAEDVRNAGHRVAIKKIKLGQLKEGIDVSAIREVKFLQDIKHPYIINVILLTKGKE